MQRVRETLRLKHECGVTDREDRPVPERRVQHHAAGLGGLSGDAGRPRARDDVYASRQQGARRKAKPDCIDGLVPSAGHTSRDLMRQDVKTEAFDGKEGRAEDSATEPVPGGHTLVSPLKSIQGR